MMKAVRFELTFLKKEKQAKNIYSFYFDRVRVERGSGKRGSAGHFDFIPGQYLKIYLPIDNPDERGTSRYFTISSSPTDRSFLTITTKIIKSSYKLSLNNLKSGDKVSAFGPIGYFDFNVKNKRAKIFLAGGMGITPYHSILEFIEAKKINTKLILMASFSSRDEVIFQKELKAIEKNSVNIKIVYALTNKKNSNAQFESGRINQSMIKKFAHDYKDADFFIVGPEAFEKAMLTMIKNMGVREENIFTENFPGY